MEYHRIHHDQPIYFLTFTIVDWLPIFISAQACRIITDSLNYCHQHKGLRINAFVIMPTHMHIIVFDMDYEIARLKQTLQAFRKFTGRQLADYCEQSLPEAFKVTIRQSTRTDRQRHVWQQSKRPEAIWSEPFWRTKFDYIHQNPVRKGLVWEAVDWRFSSAGYWLLAPSGETDVVLTGIQWG